MRRAVGFVVGLMKERLADPGEETALATCVVVSLVAGGALGFGIGDVFIGLMLAMEGALVVTGVGLAWLESLLAGDKGGGIFAALGGILIVLGISALWATGVCKLASMMGEG